MSAAAPPPAPASAPPAPALAWDHRRNSLSLVTAVGVSLACLVGSALVTPLRFTLDTVTLTSFVFWIAYSATFTVLTQITFTGVDGVVLKQWMLASAPAGDAARPRHVRFLGTGSGLNVQWSLLAILAVILVLAVPGLADSVLANALAFGVVAAAWIVTVFSYAVHYARLDALETTLDFPGSGPPVFLDYFYLAGQIATTFSSSDVSVLTTRGRSVVTGQTMIAFVYSTVIIAVLIGVIFLGT